MNIEESVTVTVKRSQITLNPENIKSHSKEDIEKQKRNIRRNGILGGIVWNMESGNLISGHRRVMALDSIHHYEEGDPSTDYDIKVEKVEFDRKTEREQMVFMSVADTRPDFNLVANIIDEIDYKYAGLTEEEYNTVLSLQDIDIEIPIEEITLPKGLGKASVESPQEDTRNEVQHTHTDRIATPESADSFTEPLRNNDGTIARDTLPPVPDPVDEMSEDELTGEQKKEIGKINKQYTQEVAERRNSRLSLVAAIKFADEEEKMVFCDKLGIPYDYALTINASEILERMK